jgi:hypothetical protein
LKRPSIARKSLLYKVKGRGATFRLVGSKHPKEEVSSWGAGVFRGREIRVLETIVLTRKGSVDLFKGRGAISGLGGSYALYRIEGVAGGTGDFGEKITGKMTFDSKCTGAFKDFKNANALFDSVVTSKGGFETRVWKEP